MVVLAMVAGGVSAALFVPIVRYQHLLYRQPENRASPLRGRRLFAHALAVAFLSGLAIGLACRPGFGGPVASALTSVAIAVLVLVSSTDIHRRLIPDRLILPAIAAAALVTPLWPERTTADLWIGGAAAFAIGCTLYLGGLLVGALLRTSETPFGLGDVKLIVFIGFVTGWPAVLTAMFVGVVVAGLPALVLLLAKRSRSVFSYGPYLALGASLVLLFPERFGG